jgi:two-component system osmolarity sensor histidine kinase EnvZ
MTPSHPIKRFLPKTLFARALLILMMPTLILQLFLIYQFYERHWDSVLRNMSTSLAGEVELLYRDYEIGAPWGLLEDKAKMLGIRLSENEAGSVAMVKGRGQEAHSEFYRQLKERLGDAAFMIEPARERGNLKISLSADRGILQLEMTEKRLVSSTTYIFLLWSVGSSIVLLVIATLFLRNQVRPIRQLARAAERFGLGQEASNYRPSGASEVRQAGRAFLVMQSRIQRQVKTRTEMLAGISHDLRTPLTRMKLQLAMLDLQDKHQQELQTDISEMEHMIDEYLQFARGQQKEESTQVVLADVLQNIVDSYLRQDEPVSLTSKSNASLALRPKAFRRALQNLIDNALRYGQKAQLELYEDGAYLVVSVRDNGPGIPTDKQEEVFRPFARLDPSRSQNTSGAGLGLSICRDIIQAHGGTIELRNRKKGLQVLVNLPRNVHVQEA